jgi:hypothetical protein
MAEGSAWVWVGFRLAVIHYGRRGQPANPVNSAPVYELGTKSRKLGKPTAFARVVQFRCILWADSIDERNTI